MVLRTPWSFRGCRFTITALALSTALTVAALSLAQPGGEPLPTADDVKQQQSLYEAERDELAKSGAAKLFQPQLLNRAELFAKKAAGALAGGRLLQARQAFVQARWQLPYAGPTVPKHVSRVLGNLQLRHSGGINQVAYSTDGKWLATASDDRTVKLWDLENGHEVRQLVGHGDAVRTLAFSPDGKMLASAGGDDVIKIWNPADGKPLQTIKAGGSYVNAIAFSSDSKYLLSAWNNKAIRIYEAATGNLARTIGDFQQSVEHMAFTADGKVFGAAVADGQIQLFAFPAVVQNPNQPSYWSFNNAKDGANYHIAFSPDGKRFARCYPVGVKLHQAAEPQQPPNPNSELAEIPAPAAAGAATPIRLQCSLFSKDGKTLFTGGSDGVIRLYDVANPGSGKPPVMLGTLKGHNGAVTSLAWNRDGTELASSSADHTVRVWPFDVVAQSRVFAGHQDKVWSAALSPDGQRIVSASADKTLRIWDVATTKVVHTLEGHKSAVTYGVFSPDGGKVLSASGDKTLILWDANTGKPIHTFEGHQSTVTAVDFSRDGKHIVSGGVDKQIKIWEVGGKEIVSIPVTSVPMVVAFHPDGKQVASGHIDQMIRLWDAATGKAGASWAAHGGSVSGLSFDQHGQLLASCGTDAVAKVWPMSNPGNQPEVFAGHQGELSSVSLRADGKLLLSGGSDGVVKLWQIGKGGKQTPQDFRGHSEWVSSVAFSKDGYYFVSASTDKTVRLWELTNKELPLLAEHTGAVTAVAVSPDGALLASAATDQTIKVWDLKTGVEKITLRLPGAHAVALSFTPEGKTLFSSSTDRNICHWDVTTGEKAAGVPAWTGLKQPAPVLQVLGDGKKLLAWTPENSMSTRVKLYEIANGAVLMDGSDTNRNVLAAALTPDGKTLALAAADGSVRIYVVENNQMEVQPGGDWFNFKIGTRVTGVGLAADGKTVAAGTDKGELKIADVTQRKVLHTINAHGARLRVCVVSPDGKRVATAGDDNVVKLWDVANGKLLRQWDINVPEQVDRGFVTQLAFTPDGRQLISANANTTLYVLELP